jgi:hypothetical protein
LIATKDGKSLTGLVREDGAFLRVLTADRETRIARKDVEERSIQKVSIVPEGQEATRENSIVAKPVLTVETLQNEARQFSITESTYPEPTIFGVTDGKAIGTYLEHKFQQYLEERYVHAPGNSALGIDCPGLEVDMKVTSVRQPQSSCSFQNARQKIYGLGYSLLVFVYDKTDDQQTRTATLNILHTIFIQKHRTADYQTTRGLIEILNRDGNEDDLVAFMTDRMLPVDEIEMQRIARELLRKPPEQGYLTISNALQWRLQYGRVIQQAGSVDGIIRIR